MTVSIMVLINLLKILYRFHPQYRRKIEILTVRFLCCFHAAPLAPSIKARPNPFLRYHHSANAVSPSGPTNTSAAKFRGQARFKFSSQLRAWRSESITLGGDILESGSVQLSLEPRLQEYVRLNGKYLAEAEALLDKADYAQASEKLWGGRRPRS